MVALRSKHLELEHENDSEYQSGIRNVPIQHAIDENSAVWVSLWSVPELSLSRE